MQSYFLGLMLERSGTQGVLDECADIARRIFEADFSAGRFTGYACLFPHPIPEAVRYFISIQEAVDYIREKVEQSPGSRLEDIVRSSACPLLFPVLHYY